MIATRVWFVARRLALPALCLTLAVAAAAWGEDALISLAGIPTVGSLSAHTAALLLASAFAVLCIITMLLSLSPETSAASVEVTEEALNEVLAGLADLDLTDVEEPERPRGKHAAPVADTSLEGASAPVVIAALKQAALVAANGRAAAERRAEEAEARAARFQERIEALHDGTSPEAQALLAQVREAAHRDALSKVTDLGDTSNRLITSLKDALARAEAELADLRQRAQDEVADLTATHAAEIAAVREQATLAEYERIKVALLALNRTHTDVLDPMQREAVARHQQRLVDAFEALDAAHRHVVLPPVPRPALAAQPGPRPEALDEQVPVEERPRKKRALRRR